MACSLIQTVPNPVPGDFRRRSRMLATSRALMTFALALAVGVALPAGGGFAANSGGGGSSSSGGGGSSSSSSSTSVPALYKQASAKADARDYRGAMTILDKI